MVFMQEHLSLWRAVKNVTLHTCFSALLLFALGQPIFASAQPVVVRDLAVLVDGDGTETIASVSAAAAQQRFTPVAGAFNAGFTRKVHWLRFSVPAAKSPWWLEVEPAFLDDLRLFEPSATGFIEQRSGDLLPFGSRAEAYREFIFKLNGTAQANSTYFLRLQTSSTSMANLLLWQPEAFNTARSTDYLKLGIFYGLMLFALLSNTVIWLVLRKPIFGWFSLFIFANLASNFSRDGLLGQYLLPTSPLMADRSVGFSMLFFLSAGAPFFWRVLEIGRERVFYFTIYRLQVLLPCLLLPSVILGFYQEAIIFALTFAGLASLLVLHQAFLQWRADVPERFFVLLGACLITFGGMNAALIILGLLPGVASANTVQQASYIVVIFLFQIALAMRLRRLGAEHQQLEQNNSRLLEETDFKDSRWRSNLRQMLSEKITLLEAAEQNKVELEKSEFLWRFAVEGSGDGVWDHDLQTGDVVFSSRWLEILGYDKKDIAPRFDGWEGLLHPDDRLHVLEADKAYRKGETASYRVEFRMKCKDGSYKSILSRGMIVSRGTDGRPLRMIGTHTDLTPLREAEAQIHHLSYHDPRTNLPNIHQFENTLSRELAAAVGGRFYGAVFFVRFADFSLLSDTRGQRCSDSLAVQIAQRLSAVVRPGDTVARRDTCDFAIIVPRLDPHETQALALATQLDHRLRQAVSKPFTIDGVSHPCRLNIGISLFRYPDKVEEIAIRAGLALSQATTERLNQPYFFQPELRTKMEHAQSLAVDLRHALDLSQFVLYYQPQLNAAHQVVGAEALLRWQHPNRGMVGPDLFIAMAEQTDLILPIGLWVLKTACEQLKVWETDADLSTLQLAVNVSPKQFEQTDFMAQLQQVLTSTGANPQRLKFELTESLVLSDIQETISKMLQIKQLGVTFAIDDFGTGFSSLSYLARLPLDQIKIDKAFVHNIPDNGPANAVTQSIIAMAKGLNMAVIAEGVETQAQREALELQGCHVYQGYLFSKPLPLAQFEEYVKLPAEPAPAISEHSNSRPHPH